MFPLRRCPALATFALGLLAGNSYLCRARDQSDKEFSICELMVSLKSQRHKIVRVRGELFAGTETTALGDKNCSKPFVTDGIKWATAIDLVSSSYGPPNGEPPAPFDTESSAMARLASAIAERSRRGGNVRVVMSVTGFLRVRSKYVPVKTGYGEKGNGYGHLGVYPAQLVIKTIGEITFAP